MSETMFVPAPFFLLRSPFWTHKRMEALLEGREEATYLYEKDPLFQEAVAIASASTAEMFQKGKKQACKATLFKYALRMSGRATPFGLFSFVGSGRWGDGNSKLDLSLVQRKARPDMAWIFAYLQKLYEDETLFPSLLVEMNQLVEERGDRFVLDYVRVVEEEKQESFSIRASMLVKAILHEVTGPICAGDLCEKVVGLYPHLDPQKTLGVIAQLCKQQFLLPSLLPSLLQMSPFESLLKNLPATDPLHGIAQDISEYERLNWQEGALYLPKLKKRMKEIVDTKSVLQIDAVYKGDFFLPKEIGEELCKAAELVWKLSPSKVAGSAIAKYHRRFVDKYGTDRTVPILELLDAERGLGSFDPDDATAGVESGFKLCLEKWLHTKWQEALKTKKKEVVLNNALVEELYALSKDKRAVPEEGLVSMDVFFKVYSESREGIESGDYLVEFVQPSWHGGSGIGRFYYLLDEETRLLAKEYVAQEEALESDALFFDASLWPKTGSFANVSTNPSFRGACLDLQDKSGTSFHLNDIYVGARGDRLYLTRKDGGSELIFRAGNFLNALHTPNAFRFMREVSLSRFQLFHPFYWGSLERKACYLPRVRFQKTILSLAKWNLDSRAFTKEDPLGQFLAWADLWDLPERCWLMHMDHQMLVDRNNPASLQEVLLKIKKGELLQFLEAPSQSWAESDEGSHGCEFILPLLKNSAYAQTKSLKAPAYKNIDFSERFKLPNDEWLFAKIYLSSEKIDRFLTEHLVELAEEGLDFFFVRYSDPDSHLRIRFKVNDEPLFDRLNQRAALWMQQGIVKHVIWAPYEREVERYGGIEKMAEAEAIFCADSMTVLQELLSNGKQDVVSHTLSGIRFLKRCALNTEEMKSLLEIGAQNKEQLTGFREHKKVLLQSLEEVLSEEVDTIKLSFFDYEICSSLLHMHYNRLGCSQLAERKARLYALHALYQKEHALNSRCS